jgi:hypothetical protein
MRHFTCSTTGEPCSDGRRKTNFCAPDSDERYKREAVEGSESAAAMLEIRAEAQQLAKDWARSLHAPKEIVERLRNSPRVIKEAERRVEALRKIVVPADLLRF